MDREIEAAIAKKHPKRTPPGLRYAVKDAPLAHGIDWRAKPLVKKCSECEAEFTQVAPNQKTCGKKCGRARNLRRENAKP